MNRDYHRLVAMLPAHVGSGLIPPPKTGGGFHQWLFTAAKHLHRHRVPEDRIRELLASAAEECGRYVPAREIEDALQNSKPEHLRIPSTAKGGYGRHRKKWPDVDTGRQQEIIRAETRGVDDLVAASPVRPGTANIIDVLRTLFPGDPLLTLAKTEKLAFTGYFSEWEEVGLAGMNYIVPNAAVKAEGMTKAGEPSPRSLDMFPLRHYIVVEFDGLPDEASQVAVHLHLARFAKLVMCVRSGGKSIHGWYLPPHPDQGTSEADWPPYLFFREAVSLGADQGLWTRNQLTRLPGGTNAKTGRNQDLLYLDPTVLPWYGRWKKEGASCRYPRTHGVQDFHKTFEGAGQDVRCPTDDTNKKEN